MSTSMYRSGFVALIGPPNAGKSTLLNALLDEKVAITSPKVQTTRQAIRGIVHRPDGQCIFVDTPGLHRKAPRRFNRMLNRAALQTLSEVDLVLLMVSAKNWTEEAEWVLEHIKSANKPTILLLNKMDLLPDKESLLPRLSEAASRHAFLELVPVSALKGENVEHILETVWPYLPEGPPYYPETTKTDQSESFRLSELVREKLMIFLKEELPYVTHVAIETCEPKGAKQHIEAVIWVEKAQQKGIVIGKGGQQLKKIGQAARLELETYLKTPVYLNLWVKVKNRWTHDSGLLKQLGYGE